ncbi:uncharacterized protein LOC144349973 [Saccoglossus kowalevskii]
MKLLTTLRKRDVSPTMKYTSVSLFLFTICFGIFVYTFLYTTWWYAMLNITPIDSMRTFAKSVAATEHNKDNSSRINNLISNVTTNQLPVHKNNSDVNWIYR